MVTRTSLVALKARRSKLQSSSRVTSHQSSRLNIWRAIMWRQELERHKG